MITNPIFLSIFNNELQKNKTKRLGMIYNFYRVIIALFFSLNFIIAVKKSNQDLLVIMNLLPTFGYLLFAIGIVLVYHFYPRNLLLMFGLMIDFIALSIMLYFSGGSDLQIILLFFVQVASSFMLVSSHQATLLTLFAISLVMYQQFYQPLKGDLNYSLLNEIGLMTASFIIVAYLSDSLSKRVKQIEALSERQITEVNVVNSINKKIVQIIEQGVMVVSHDLEVLIANDNFIKQLQLPSNIENFSLTNISTELANLIKPYIKEHEETLIFRQHKHETNKNIQIFTDYRLRITQLEKNLALILVEDLRREQAHAQQLKLASLGQLTASIAHEIRNPLASISYASEMLIEDAHDTNSPLSDDNLELYQTIFQQTIRVNKIIEDVLKLSRQKKPNQIYIEPKTWLPVFLKENFIDQDIELHCHTDNGFLFDNYQLEQVLVNLIKNGLRFSKKLHAHAFVDLDVYDAGKFIHLDVIDLGAGVAENHIQDLFNPFFTTDNDGTGLGLYLSQAFCQANHADLEYVIEHEHTCFRIICNKKFIRSVFK
ncbi:sensor signal transduction histidine kinase [Moraxella macacae 0408225]|uniref:histidine kinase n=1 Tax=Moraxella macacae 0408225 TaxID=1230338 RepID=L2F5N9_9GAMM|nr:histidine kinase dimerization/phospho-acceptor domain-containing protein [Moraxella macacae]ELA08071.1 sensor signal transduction histidine kinase [Moraxella macacae 0408225]